MKIYILLPILVFFIACNKDSELRLKGEIFGTYYSVLAYSDKEDLDNKELKREIDQYLSRLDYIYSTYKKDSDLSKLNSYRSIEKVAISAELYSVLKLSKEIYEETDGYFDVTVGPIVNAWGFGPEGKQKKPTEKEIEMLSQFIGMDKLTLFENGDIKKQNDGIYVDLSAIAKGLAVDKLLLFIKEKGFKSALVEIGGEVRAFGKKADNKSFRIGIEKPNEVQSGEIINIVELNDMAMATSGSYRNYKKYQEQVFSHTIDPKTKKPAMNKVISVTVLHKECAYADAYATGLMAMGTQKALEFANNKGLAVYILVKKGEIIDIVTSKTFPKK